MQLKTPLAFETVYAIIMLTLLSGGYELVTHKVKPGMMPQLEHRLEQGLPARLAEDYPQALGLWVSEFGQKDLCKFIYYS